MGNIGKASTIKKLLTENQLQAKKKFGQNFLVDGNILKNIVKLSGVQKDTPVIEIGPGLGSLTEGLLNNAKKVLAYEIDKDFIPILQRQFIDQPLDIIEDDFLKRNIDEDISKFLSDKNDVVVVSNLPYYITTPIIFKILEESTKIRRMVFMMQLEVARRMTSKPSTKDYNALSVIIQYKTHATFGLKIPKSVFIPEPNVDSAVIVLDQKEPSKLIENQEHFIAFVKASFKQRRKTLINNLAPFFNIEKTSLIEDLTYLGYNPSIRAEKCNVEDFIKMHVYFYHKYIKSM